jgi:protease IV
MGSEQTSGRGCLGGFAKLVVVLLLGGFIAFFLMIAALAGLAGRFGDVPKERKPHLVLLRVEGALYEADPLLGILARLRKDPHCKGVLVRVDSPGGAVGASQELHASLRALREKGIPVAVSFGNVAASGGYYVALAGERIFANPGSLTGSIGVIVQFPEVEKLMEKAGISLQTVKSGALKDVGNPARRATAEELRYLQGVIDDTHAQFLEDVAAARGMTRDSAGRLADGRVFTGRQALSAGLVDTLGGLDDARAWLIARAGVPEDIAWVREPRPRSRMEQFLNPEAGEGLAGVLTSLRQRVSPGMYYLWP